MKVMLQKDVKDLGRVGDVVSVSQGYARNFLFPRKMALMATEGKIKEWTHLQKMAEVKKKKARSEREKIISDVNGQTVTFKAQAGEGDKLFGSITSLEVSKELSLKGFEIDKRDILIEEPIKMLGQYKAIIQLSDDLKGEVTIVVEKA